MFWRKKDDVPVAESAFKEEQRKDIFSADDAKRMGIEAINKKRNMNRIAVFKSIKTQIDYGNTKSNVAPGYLNDGNNIYFEGLGFKLKPVWIDQQGQTLYEDPGTAPVAVNQWSSQGYQGQLIMPIYYPQHYIQISWE